MNETMSGMTTAARLVMCSMPSSDIVFRVKLRSSELELLRKTDVGPKPQCRKLSAVLVMVTEMVVVLSWLDRAVRKNSA